jgi:hypothetical protein
MWLVSGTGAQTQVDLRTQSKGVDFRSAPSTKPLKAGAALPQTCEVGDLFYLENAPVGTNVHSCVGLNTWAAQGVPLNGMSFSGSVLKTDGVKPQWVSPGGDLAGSPEAARVQGLQARPVSATAPQVGQALTWDGLEWKGQTVGGAPGTVTLESNNVPMGTRGVVNLIPGFGVISMISDSGTKLNVQQTVDTAAVLSKAAFQAGGALKCSSGGGSGTAYTCALSPTLTSYSPGMLLHWLPDVNGSGGATTLDVDILGPVPVKLMDGTADPSSEDIRGGRMNLIWHDGVVFRMIDSPRMVMGAPSGRPDCNAAMRGKIWALHGGSGVKDDVSVCAKDAADGYGWRTVY